VGVCTKIYRIKRDFYDFGAVKILFNQINPINHGSDNVYSNILFYIRYQINSFTTKSFFMKQKLQNLFFLFLLGTIGAKAQGPVITAAGFNPQIGDSYKMQNTKYIKALPKLTGANLVWDFSNLIDSGVAETTSYVLPEGFPYLDSFPTTNIACLHAFNTSTNASFYQTTDSNWLRLGDVFQTTNPLANSSPVQIDVLKPGSHIFIYPLTYNTNYTDSNTYYNYLYGTDSTSSSNFINYDTIIGIGYGSLKLPTDTYDSVLCVYFGYNNYGFMKNGIHAPLLSIHGNYNGWNVSYYKAIDTTPVLKPVGPVITAAGFNPRIGDSYKILQANNYQTFTNFIGANRLWDFSNLQVNSAAQVQVDSFYSPNANEWLTYADSFPNSNITIQGSNQVTYFQTSNASWGYLGNYYYDINSGITSISHNIPADPIMVYPMAMNINYTDSIQFYNWSTDYPNPTIYTQYDTLIGVGYGTLKLPTGTYDSVVCVYIGSGGYWFVTNGIHCPLLTLAQAYDDNGIIINGLWQAYYYSATPLPLQISSFTASWQNKMPYLQWEAANTENTKAFNIQRSVDGHSFSTVGQVGVSGGSSYHFEDNYIPTSTVYYRIEQVDKNGQTFYSSKAQLTVNSKQLTVYPNPAKGTIHVSVPSGNAVHVMIYDVLGRLVYENKTYASAQPIATDAWGKGTYLVRVKDNDGWKVSSFEIN